MIESEWKMVTLTSGNGKSGQSLLVLKLGNRFKVKIDAATGVPKQKNKSSGIHRWQCLCSFSMGKLSGKFKADLEGVINVYKTEDGRKIFLGS